MTTFSQLEKLWQREGHEVARDRPRVRAGVPTQTKMFLAAMFFAFPMALLVSPHFLMSVSFHVLPSPVTNRPKKLII